MSKHQPIASLPMYDWPELTQVHDQFWQDISCILIGEGIKTPPYLTRLPVYSEAWYEPGLVLSQTCGYPFANSLAGKVKYLATPVYDVEGCGEGTYASAVIVNKDSYLTYEHLDGASFAYNSLTSWSGYHVLVREFGDLNSKFGTLIESGGHRFSAGMVAEGKADCCVLDAVCWSLLNRFEPQTADRLKVAGWTSQKPALPFITSLETPDHHAAKIISAIREVISGDQYKDNCRQLSLKDCVVFAAGAYEGFSDQ